MESVGLPSPGPVVRPPAVVFRLASDARLSRLAAAGSDGAMAEIFDRHHQALHRYCYSLLGDSHDAADALQNTMVKALRALPGETRQIALRPWLYRIAHNESISLLRARRSDSDLDAAAHIGDPTAAGTLDSRERLRSLTDDLSELTERQRAALLMRELGGLEFTEVAEALGTSASAVKQSAYEARCALQSMQEGRAMECETVRRTLSDGDRRMLRGLRIRGHLRACAGCRDFEVALRRRPAQLAALIPPLPIAAAAGIMHGLLGGGSAGSAGGLLGGLTGTAQITTGMSLVAKAGVIAAVTATLAGGAVYAVPKLESTGPERSTPRSEPASTPPGTATQESAAAAQSAGSPSSGVTAGVQAGRHGSTSPAGARSVGGGKPSGSPRGRPAGTGKPGGTPGGKPAGAGKPAETPGGKPAGAGKRAGTSGAAPRGPAGSPAARRHRRAGTGGAGAVIELGP